jgi:hypothetical protein
VNTTQEDKHINEIQVNLWTFWTKFFQTIQSDSTTLKIVFVLSWKKFIGKEGMDCIVKLQHERKTHSFTVQVTVYEVHFEDEKLL